MTEKDIDFLYHQLEKRDTKVNISHKKMPTYSQHKKFVLSKPYRKWQIIIYNNHKIGSVYLTDINEIGLHLSKEYDTNQIKKEVLKKLLREDAKKRYLVNLSPKNKSAIKFFKSQGFDLIQQTYELQRK